MLEDERREIVCSDGVERVLCYSYTLELWRINYE